jgi:hypothetical protein
MMTQSPQEFVRVAYKKLKQMVYYDKNHLSFRKRLAEFECAADFESRLNTVAEVISSEAAAQSKEFQGWLDDIDYDLIPKAVAGRKKTDKEKGTFVTNLTTAKTYSIEKVNYLFNGPIELHLTAVLWLMTEGTQYDQMISLEHSMGSRLHNYVGKDDDHSAHLFKKYHELYSHWRNKGIDTAKHMLVEKGQSVCLLGLDIQEYYYRIQVDWRELHDEMKRDISSEPI